MEKKLLFYSSAILAALFFLAALFMPHPQSRISLDTSGFPTVGDHTAPVHIVLVEELACAQCKRLHAEEMPLIKEHYIDTGKAKLTTIPLAFAEASKIPFLSLHCATSQGSVHFHQFIERFFSLPVDKLWNQTERELLTFYAKDHPDFSQSAAISCVRHTAFAPLLAEQERLVAPIFKGNQIELPTILINGRRVQKIDWKTIQTYIEEELVTSKTYVENR
ncbi:MAG: thioredoxin domain-containing protein [Verrucomicrobia bacterium]|nr:thioredoxin domain-containing protein [Verrucomicrobiota bacterium]